MGWSVDYTFWGLTAPQIMQMLDVAQLRAVRRKEKLKKTRKDGASAGPAPGDGSQWTVKRWGEKWNVGKDDMESVAAGLGLRYGGGDDGTR